MIIDSLRYKQLQGSDKVHLIYLHFQHKHTQLLFTSESTIRSSRGLVIILIPKTGLEIGKLLMPVQNCQTSSTPELLLTCKCKGNPWSGVDAEKQE
ncbi:hypothetical protein EVAR_4946_1 [Eumeta japonica]|uniref:Uncharacterized protein n=1 Tax=Eumeta variegata TaxID=151549 RepID=A0A4C1UZN4_EUMVA|nr:hypothetical protein EVAR_4946_1 [Eumeta japonica]